MITKSFGTKVVINPITINSFSQDDKLKTAVIPPPEEDALLQENGFYLLQENGDKILLG